MMWLPQNRWLCGHSPQSLCRFLSSARLVRPASQLLSPTGTRSRAAPLSRAALAHVVISEDEPSRV